ncbi:DgyrCDS4334 [Dimorphilus gyrociliatus]|uniref:DNA topoisomerase 2 n=1 Tax=Dimorphilus gyrociliatus TaxID=2664684 RepID=A0A7I8VGP5_9ANNE|nr:DgyrCDS4334 [Dimorphilus gyrociliatus]
MAPARDLEDIYQKKTQLEHVLLRPDTYIGSIHKHTEMMWVYNDEKEQMIQRELTYVPGLYKIFDEIMVNAADNKQRDREGMTRISIEINSLDNKIRIENNGEGIPIEMHKKENMYIPTMIFGHLLTSSNFNDDEKKVTGGRNGFGAKLCNIFSKKFIVETTSSKLKRSFKQVWEDNMMKTSGPMVKDSNKSSDSTAITFYPDLKKFDMTELDKDICDLFKRRAYDVAASTRGVKVMLNGKKLQVNNFKDYIQLFIKDKEDDSGNKLKVAYELVNERWEIAATISDKGMQQVSFVNSIATTKGGKHVDYIADQIANRLVNAVKKKEKKGSSVVIKPFQVKNHLWIFINCLIENPSYDSQTKESMNLQAKKFGSKCEPSEKFFGQVEKCGIIDAIQSWIRFKDQEKLTKKCSAGKHNKLKGIPKLDDANDAGTRNSSDCTLILTEGDSAKTLAVAGLGIIGRDKYGVFPLRGKLLNVREATTKQIMENAEINNLIKILGLNYGNKYDDPESIKKLRYGKIMIMTDQDQDGSHIKGLIINFIHNKWPNLLKYNFIEEFITPIVKVSKKDKVHSFYSIPEFEEWKKATPNWHVWKVKYYKGLGTSTSKEAKEYFMDMQRHRIKFRFGGSTDEDSILLAFSKKKIEERKTWLTEYMNDRKERHLTDRPEVYLYGKDTKTVTYSDFVNKELILFSNADNERSIPSVCDGLKPGQRKVLFACFKRKQTKEVKVAQLSGAVAELSAYHHGEGSLMATIINLAQNFVGSNNINILVPVGQFGTRLNGGKDAASPRYIFTQLSPLARKLFHEDDDPLLLHLYDDNQRIEPNHYVPILPMVLVNGAEGIGTGWSTKVPNYNPRDIVENLKLMMDGLEPRHMEPWYKNFRGEIIAVDETKYASNGEVSLLNEHEIEITELPVKTWTQPYKETVLHPMLQGTEKTPSVIQDFREYHTDTTVKFVVKMSEAKMSDARQMGLHKYFKIQTTMSLASMVLFDTNGCIRRYNNPIEILKEFYGYRLKLYGDRKSYMENMLEAEMRKLTNMARFIVEKIEGKIKIEDRKKKDIIAQLVQRDFEPDPVKSWKEKVEKERREREKADSIEDQDKEEETEDAGDYDFQYLLGMPIYNLSREKKEEFLKKKKDKEVELNTLKKKSPKDLWREDLNDFIEELEKVEEKERADAGTAIVTTTGKTGKGRGKTAKVHLQDTKPSQFGERVPPVLDPALRTKVLAEANRKRKAAAKKEDGKQRKIDDFLGNVDSDDSMPPLEQVVSPRTSAEQSKPKAEPKKKRKTPAEPSTFLDEPKKKGKPKKEKSPKKPKKKAWEMSDSESEIVLLSDNEEKEDLDSSDIQPRAKSTRARVTKYTIDSDSEDETEGEIFDIDIESDDF